MAETMEA
jgi:hypothetical protein